MCSSNFPMLYKVIIIPEVSNSLHLEWLAGAESVSKFPAHYESSPQNDALLLSLLQILRRAGPDMIYNKKRPSLLSRLKINLGHLVSKLKKFCTPKYF
jgi:hypothetical protein